MAGTVNVGSGGTSNNGASWTGASWIRTGYSMPTGNLAWDGSRPVRINSASLSGTKSNVKSVSFNGYLYAYKGSGSMYFSRYTGDGRSVTDSTGYTWSNGGIHGSYNWSTCPAQMSPPSVSASSTVSGRIDFSWSAPDSGNDGIFYYYIFQDGNPVVGTSNTSGYVDGLTVGSSYQFAVSAINGVAVATPSGYSNWVTVRGVSSEPRNLRGSTATTGWSLGRVDLYWDAPAISGDGGSFMYVIKTLVDGNWYDWATTSNTSLQVANLTPGRSYTFAISAINSFGQSGWSNQIDVTASYAPSAVQSPTAAQTGGVGEVYLTWAPPADTAGGIANYYIYQSTSPDTVYATVSGSTTTFTATGLTPGGYFGFFIRAANDAGNSANSYGPASSTVYATALGLPLAPTNLTAYNDSHVAGALTLSWAPAAGSLKTNIYYNTNPPTYITSVDATSYRIYGLTPGQEYSFIVSATNVYSEGPTSAPASATPVSTTVQTVANLAVPNTTNSTIFNGTYAITSVSSASTFTYARNSTDTVAQSSVNANIGTIVNNTADNISATNVAITTSGPTSSQFAYTRSITGTLGDIPAGTPVSSVVATNATNTNFSGTKTLSAVDLGAGTITYTAGGSSTVSSVVASGTATNLSNTTYNGTFSIYNTTETKFSYLSAATSPPDQLTSSAYGSTTNLTNGYLYNSNSAQILSVVGHNMLTYTTVPVPATLNPHGYTFSTTTTDADPGNGVVRFNNATASSVTYLYIDNVDSAGTTRTSWYSTWDDVGATTYGRVVISQNGSKWEYAVSAAVTAASGYYKIPVTYISGSSLPSAAAVSVTFIPYQHSTVYAPYGSLRKADSTAKLDIRYRSGWLG